MQLLSPLKGSYCTAIILSITLSTYAFPTNTTVIPPGAGPYGVSFSEFELVDDSRVDPFNSSHSRRIMVSRFDPVPKGRCNKPHLIPYMSPTLGSATEGLVGQLGIELPAGFFSSLSLEVVRSSTNHTYPVALFSHGNAGSRRLYSALAQDIASYGYTILAIDHPYNALLVEFPNGDTISGPILNPDLENEVEVFSLYQQVHAADMSFVLDALNIQEAVAFGHSLGGASSNTAVANDLRFRGGVNLDGTIWDSSANTTLGAPGSPQSFVLWESENQTNGPLRASYASFKEAQVGAPDVEFIGDIALQNTLHYAYLDAPLLFDVTGTRETYAETIAAVFGTISGARLRTVLSHYLIEFFDFALGRGGDVSIFTNPPAGFEDVVVVR